MVFINIVSVLALLYSFVSTSKPFEAANDCRLDFYDTSTIQNREEGYWFFNHNISNSSHSTTYFALCQSLPEGVCKDDGGYGVCSEQVVHNPTTDVRKSIILGRVNDKVFEYNNTAVTNVTGFYVLYESTIIDKTCMGMNTTVIGFFACNVSAVWNTRTGDVTKHLFYVSASYFLCGKEVDIGLFYSGACEREISDLPVFSNNSNSSEYFSLTGIKSQSFYKVTAPLSQCKSPHGDSKKFIKQRKVDDSTCDLFFSFWQPLPYGICYNSVFCQHESTGDVTSFGSFNSNLNFDSNFNDSRSNFTITAYNGTITSECPEGMYSVFVFKCSRTSNWNAAGKDITQFATLIPNNDKCEFLVIFHYDGACVGSSVEESSLSVAVILIIVVAVIIGMLICFVTVYFVVGGIVQFARGSKGAQIVPNYKFWKKLFTIVCGVCCYSQSKKYSSAIDNDEWEEDVAFDSS